jgi:hypothetical protein
MELAIPLVALGGLYIISNHSKSDNKENFESRKNKTNVLPNIDVDNRNYPEEYPVKNAQDDLTSQLSTVNKYDGTAYTDKYFDSNSSSNIVNKEIEQNTSKYYSLSGQKVDSAYFKHTNMQPYFGSHLRGSHLDANSGESILDNYVGSGSQTISKQERAPLFSPKEGYQYPYGMPNTSDFMQSRVNPSLKMSNVKPFAEEHIAPGINAGYGTSGVGGYNSGLIARDMYMPKNVDEMRADNKPKAGEFMLYGHEGPSNSFIKERAHLGIVEKNRVETSFPLGHDRLFTTVGIETAPMARAIPIVHHVNRPETSTEYSGVAGAHISAQQMDGEYMPSKHIDLAGPQVQPAYRVGAGGANEADYGIKSQKVYKNNRSSNRNDGYLGVAGGVITAAIAPLLDALRPSRKENTVGTLRPYQNPGTTVPNSYIFNPTDRPAPTIRETTEISSGHLFVNRMQAGGGYEVNPQQPITNNRQTQSDHEYMGVASAGERGREPRTYDAEYNQRNNDLKSSTLAGYTPGGKNCIFNPNVNMKAVPKDNDLINRRALNPSLPPQFVSVDNYGSQTTGTQLYENIQMDRTNPDILSQLKGNPFVVSHVNGL